MRRVVHGGMIAIAIAAVIGASAMTPAVASEPIGPAAPSAPPGAPPTADPSETDPPSASEQPQPSTSPGETPTAEPTDPVEPTDPAEPRDTPAPVETGSPAPDDATEPTAEPVPEGPSRFEAAAETTIAPFPSGVQRVAGADRYETAVALSQRFEPNVPVLYLATGADFPDALTAASAAALRGGPLLLTPREALPSSVRAEIVRLAPARIVVVGGESVVGASVFGELAGLTPNRVRISGQNRYETGERLVAEAFPTATQAFIATGRGFADALAASAAAGAVDAPVFLVDGLATTVRPSTIAAMRKLGVRTVHIAGGTAAVSPSIARQLTSNGFSVQRHEGLDRYLTAAAINSAVFGSTAGSVSSTFLATGTDFADALAGAALAGGVGAPLYLTQQACIPHPVWVALNQLAPATRVIIGGAAVVGDSVAANTACAMVWAKPAAGRITDGFGPRDPICTPGGCTQSVHRGVDLGTGCRAPIYAASGGRVGTAGRVGTYGNFVKIAHGAGIETAYAHMVDGGILVRVGQLVRAGQQIGWTGATGAATGCHLHFEVVQNGIQIDPVPFMLRRGIRLG
ncbi:cell wall-binding repeat-containing protein [Agromyces sp. NPDC057679]|uniref:cell wall-binding repeat-containing protein n=1 Tax=Agromyces sp. NPDC057679 TaxID=3346207 RepID=UPI00366F8113